MINSNFNPSKRLKNPTYKINLKYSRMSSVEYKPLSQITLSEQAILKISIINTNKNMIKTTLILELLNRLIFRLVWPRDYEAVSSMIIKLPISYTPYLQIKKLPNQY